MKQKILIVEDQFIEANNLQMILERSGYDVCPIAQSVPEALKIIEQEEPELVLLDIQLKGKLTGIDLAKTLKEKNIAFVYLSANADKEILDAAKVTRPYGFLIKPFREKDVMVTLDIAHYLHEHSLESKLRREHMLDDQLAAILNQPQKKDSLITENGLDNLKFPGIVGQSKPLQHVLDLLRVVIPTDVSVLILGESGTGKEKIADAIHRFSQRKSKPFVKVNCATLPATLIESELFGHEKGAFTGAYEKRVGKFQQAEGGTIFLDEIGELPLDLQAKLLRVLQEKEIEPIGCKAPVKVNLRVIAATNRNLEKEVAEGKFRIDLYYRLNVFPIVLPSLRERKDDIRELVHHFIDRHANRLGKKIAGVSEEVLDKLMNYSWPGNIRELENLVERSVLLTKGIIINEMSLPVDRSTEGSGTPARLKTMEENERDHILAALRKSNGKVFGEDGAAKLLGMNVSTLNARIKKLGIEKKKIWK